MKKKAATKKKATTKRKAPAKSRRKVATRKVTNRGLRRRRRRYSYDTPVGEVERNLGIEISEYADMKLGDYFKMKGMRSAVKMLGG